jgi:hypothetical protein
LGGNQEAISSWPVPGASVDYLFPKWVLFFATHGRSLWANARMSLDYV